MQQVVQWSLLPSEVILEILSFILVEARVLLSEREFFKYYFGRFSINGNLEFIFRTLEWKGCSLDVNCAWQLFRVEQMIHNHKRIDLIDPVKSKALSPGDDSSEEQVLTKLDQLIERIDPSIVKSIYLDNEKVPKYIMDWALEKFTELDTLILVVLAYVQPYISVLGFLPKVTTFKNLKSLEIDAFEIGLTNSFIEISRETPHMEIFKNSSLTSIFTAPETFSNWKNLKKLTSGIYFSRDPVCDEPNQEQVDKSFTAIRKLEKLEEISLMGEPIEKYGVPFCASIQKMEVGLTYASFSQILMDSISENTQLTELEFDNQDWSEYEFPFFLNHEKLTNLKKFSTRNITNELAKQISKFSSIQELNLRSVYINFEGLEQLLTIPNLKKIIHDEGPYPAFLNYDDITMIGNVSIMFV